MKSMKAIMMQEVKNFDAMAIADAPYPSPGAGEATVQIKACALNHRDVWILQGLYPNIKVPIILGSDGAGIVTEVGEGVDKSWLDTPVVINPSLGWGENPRVQRDDFRILGLPDNGTQAQYVCVPAGNLYRKPDHLSFAEAAAIPLGGVTGYRALFTQGGLEPGQTLLLTGIGGGVAALMLKMAMTVGAKVLVTSGSDEKIENAVRQGARGGANYKNEGWHKELLSLAGPGGIDLVVDSAGGPGFDHLVSIVKPGGRIVFFGATAGNPPSINLRKMFWRQVRLQGTTMGSETDFAGMVNLFDSHQIKPLIDGPYAFNDFRTAYQRMIDGAQFGKIVILVAE